MTHFSTPVLRSALRKLVRDDRGDTMMEVIGSLVVVMIVSTVFTMGFISASGAQNRAHANDVAAQVARGVFEQAKATPFDQLGFAATDANYRATYSSRETVTLPASELPSDRLVPYKTGTRVRDVPVTIRVDITWRAVVWPTKVINVSVSWRHKGVARSRSFQSFIAATPNDSAVQYDNLPLMP